MYKVTLWISSLGLIFVCSMKTGVNDNDFFVDFINYFIDDNIQPVKYKGYMYIHCASIYCVWL